MLFTHILIVKEFPRVIVQTAFLFSLSHISATNCANHHTGSSIVYNIQSSKAFKVELQHRKIANPARCKNKAAHRATETIVTHSLNVAPFFRHLDTCTTHTHTHTPIKKVLPHCRISPWNSRTMHLSTQSLSLSIIITLPCFFLSFFSLGVIRLIYRPAKSSRGTHAPHSSFAYNTTMSHRINVDVFFSPSRKVPYRRSYSRETYYHGATSPER